MVHMVNGTPTDSIIYSKNRQFRSGVNMKTGRCCCDSVFSQRRTVYVYEQPKIPTAAKVGMWAMAIGFIAKAATSVVNFFTGIFGKKKASAPVQTPAATQNNQVTPDKQGVNTPTPSVATPQKDTTPQEVKPEKEENNNKKQTNEKKYKVPSSVEMKDFSGNITVHDDELFEKLGEKSDITGKTTVSAEKGQGGYPTSMKVGNYNYTLAKVDENGTVWYKSQNGSGQLYRLEKNNNGTYGLNQHSGDNGVGEADVSKWKKTTTTSSKKTQTPTSTTTTTSTNSTQSTTTQANSSQQKTTSTGKKTPANTSIRTDDELKDTMSIGREISDFKNTKWGTEKTYSPMTVTYGYSPEMQTVNISAEEVAECQGDEAKIKDLALKKIREKEQPESKKTK